MDQTTERGASLAALAAEQVFNGDGEMTHLMRAKDWSQTPLGPLQLWPQSLRTMVSVCLASRFPILIWWGPDLAMLYNDAYRDVIGAKHPHALGAPGRDVFPEIWDFIGPMLEGVLRDGKATWSDDQLLLLDRNGYSEECYFTFSYSPIQDESGGVGGVFCAVTETTARVLGERRTRVVRDLAAAAVDARSAEDVFARATEALARDTVDVPFALLYTLDRENERAALAGRAGLSEGHPLAPAELPLVADRDADGASRKRRTGSSAVWPVARVARTGQRTVVTDLAHRWGDESIRQPDLDLDLTPHSALVLPITEPGQPTPSAILVAGISPRRGLDDDYEGFVELLASHIASGLASAHSHEQERRRAEALAEIDRAKTAFFSNVSHEFRTPLTLLLGPLEDSLTAADDTLSERQREQLDMMHRNGLRLLKLVNTLLDFARIEAGRVQAVYEPADLATYTTELASSFRALVEQADMRLVVDCPPLDGALREPVYIDREMWEKIVLNLLSNAFKFTFEGTITVELRAAEAGGAVALRVRDTGTGIPPDELPRLFERFHRVRGARSRSFEGSGIGLALVQELVYLHGGSIAVNSQLGAGTTFTVTIPVGIGHLPADRVRDDHAGQPERVVDPAITRGTRSYVEEARRWLPDAATKPSDAHVPNRDERGGRVIAGESERGWLRDDVIEPIRSETLPGAESNRMRVLVADDNADLRDYLRRLLSERYEVEVVPDGNAALAAIRREHPDLVISDVMMPERDGFGLVRALRDDPATSAIPIILLSARAGEEATIEGLESGADDYLVKPFSAREVLTRVAARLEIARVRRELESRARELKATFEAMTDGVVMYGPTGEVRFMNAAYRRLLALDDADLRLPIAERGAALAPRNPVTGAPLAWHDTPAARLLRGESVTGSQSVDVLVRAHDGRDTLINCAGAPIRDERGRLAGAVMVIRDVGERRRLEHDIAERASLLEAIFRAVPDRITLFDAEGTIVRLNPAAQTIAGPERARARRDEITSLYDIRSLDGSPLPVEELPLARALRGDMATGEILCIRDSSGHQQTILASAAPYFDDAGRVRGVVSVAQDVTAIREAEQRASEQSAQLAAVIESMTDGVAIYDADGQLIHLNAALRTTLGIDANDEAATLSIPLEERMRSFDLYEEGERDATQGEQHVQRRVLAGEVLMGPHTVDRVLRGRDGQEHIVNIAGAPVRSPDGQPTGAVLVVRDMTERRLLERRTHDALDALLAMAEALVQTSALDAVALELATLAQRVLGCKRASIVSLDPGTDVMRPIAVLGLSTEEALAYRAAIDGAHMADVIGTQRMERMRRGEPVLLNLAEPDLSGLAHGGDVSLAVPLYVRNQLIGGLSVDYAGEPHTFTLDEIAFAAGIGKLAGVILERERITQERAAAQAEALVLGEATRRMDEFLGIASHELRTPLTSVTANVQLAERQLRRLSQQAATPEELTGLEGQPPRLELAALLLQRTERQMVRLDRLVGDLLDASRIQAGKLELRPEPCDLTEIVREAVEAQRAAWPARSIELDLPPVVTLDLDADSDRIGQVVTNLLTNALKYAPADVPVTVQVRRQGDVVRVEVRDQGPGLSREQQAHLFERFYRVPGIEQQSGSGIGLGLGLYICKTIVERHSGALGVESAPGAGSIFWFTVPLRAAPAMV